MALLNKKKTQENIAAPETTPEQEREWTMADYIAYDKKKKRKKWLIISAIFLVLFSIFYCLKNDMDFRCWLEFKLQRKRLEACADYMVKHQEISYVNEIGGNNAFYLNLDLTDEELKTFRTYFASVRNAEIISLGKNADKWNLTAFPEGTYSINFFVCGTDNGDDLNVYNVDYKNYYLCYSNMDLDAVTKAYIADDLTAYTISEMDEHWYKLVRTCFDISRKEGRGNNLPEKEASQPTELSDSAIIEKITTMPAVSSPTESAISGKK